METETKNNELLRGGQFLVKETKAEDVFTPEDFSEEQKMMRDSVKEFVDREIWPKKEEFEHKNYALTEEVMRKAGEMGLLGVAVPEEYGGLGMGFVTTMLVCDYISGATGSVATAFGAHTGIGTLPITLYGTEEQKKKYVPKLATGEWFGAYALTEPGAGSDANSGKTKAVLSEDGKHYKISGQKMWISNSGFCHTMIVFARIEDDKYITGFIVENDPENGISMGEEEKKLGIHSSSTRQVFFNETKVPVENMLGERGEQRPGVAHVVDADDDEVRRRIGRLLHETRDPLAVVRQLDDAEAARVDTDEIHRGFAVDDPVGQLPARSTGGSDPDSEEVEEIVEEIIIEEEVVEEAPEEAAEEEVAAEAAAEPEVETASTAESEEETKSGDDVTSTQDIPNLEGQEKLRESENKDATAQEH